MQKADFLQELRSRAKEQQRLRKNIPFPKVFIFIGKHLGNHPWMPLIPISVITSCVLYLLFGKAYIEFILWLFKLI